MRIVSGEVKAPEWNVYVHLKKNAATRAFVGSFYGNDKKAVERRAWEYLLKSKPHMLSSSRRNDFEFTLELKKEKE